MLELAVSSALFSNWVKVNQYENARSGLSFIDIAMSLHLQRSKLVVAVRSECFSYVEGRRDNTIFM